MQSLRMRSLHVACGFLSIGLVFPVAMAQDDPSVLGALSDSPPRELQVAGARVYLYEFARNEAFRNTNHHRDVTYFYAAQPRLRRDADGRVVVDSYPAITDPSKEIVQITIEPASVASGDVYTAMRQQPIDAYADQSRILSLMVYGIDVKVADLPLVQVPQENAAPFSEPIQVSWTLPRGGAERVRTAFESGASAQVGYRTLQKLSQLQETRLSWSDVMSTRAYRDYDGPSGPKLLTAAQTVKLARNILSELKVFHWQERAANQGGADAAQYSQQLQALVDRFVNRRERKEATFEQWLDPMRLAVPVDQWQKMVDETKTIAIDAKKLDSNEWCRKYQSKLETLAKRQSSGESGTSFGLEAVIPIIKTPIGLDFSNSDSDKDYSEDRYLSEASSEDCGKKVAEHNFKYDWDGVKYEPKSIYVHERLESSGTTSDEEQYTVYTVRQKMGRNQWSGVR